MPVKVVLPVADRPPEKVKLGPMVIMSGFMTKKTRSLKRWKQRWWQLTDNGFLHYFKSDNHPQKALGKIDVAKTCYDVKLGAEMCNVKFPRAVPSCCCFCFAVLSRIFYVYTPTPDEAQKWTQAINDLSQVINRKVVAGLERRRAPSIPGVYSSFFGNNQVRVVRVRVKGSQNCLSDTSHDVNQVRCLPVENNKLLTDSKIYTAVSLPSSLDKMGSQEGRQSQMSSYGFFLENNTSSVSSEILQEQPPEIDTMEEMGPTKSGFRLSLPYSLMREHPLPENIQQVSPHQQNQQKQQINELQDNEPKQQRLYRHQSHSSEDICSLQHTTYCHQPIVCPTQFRPVPKPRLAKTTGDSLDKDLECRAQKTYETEMIEERPAPPLSSPPPSHPSPLTSPHALPCQRRNDTTFPFSPPSSPPPPPPSQQNNVYESALPPLPLSSPPSSRLEKNIRAVSNSVVPSHPEKPFLPSRPITEIESAPFSSPPRPRKKTMTRKCQDSGFISSNAKPKPKPRSKK